jgi:hypothetical protein
MLDINKTSTITILSLLYYADIHIPFNPSSHSDYCIYHLL